MWAMSLQEASLEPVELLTPGTRASSKLSDRTAVLR